MDLKHIAKTTGVLLLAAVLPALCLNGCTITARGDTFTIGPRLKEWPTVGRKIGQVIIEGRTICLFDAGNDNVPDFAYDVETGRWYPIMAQPPSTPFMPSPEVLDLPEVGIVGLPYWSVPDGAANPTSFETGQWDWVADAIDLESGIDGSVPFDLGTLSAEQWIAAVGLDVEPETVVELDQVVDLSHFDTETWHTVMQVPWSSAFHMPDVLEYDLDYEIYGIPSDADGPTFHVIRIAGDATEVIAFLVEMGGSELEFVSLGSTWTVVADENAQVADLYENGTFVMSAPF